MSETYDQKVRRLRCNDLSGVAPEFGRRLELFVAACNDDDLDVRVFETYRLNELSKLYFDHKVSHAPDNTYSWHGYWLGADIISVSHGWDLFPDGPLYSANPGWWATFYKNAKKHGLDSGADWHSIKDYPHVQPTGIPASPTADDRTMLATDGPEAVWRKYGLDVARDG